MRQYVPGRLSEVSLIWICVFSWLQFVCICSVTIWNGASFLTHQLISQLSLFSLQHIGFNISPQAAGKKGEEAEGGSPKLGKKLVDFEINTTLGTGTFGRVRLVKDKSDGAFYALKILKKHAIIRLKQVEHIKSEVALLSKISHPFIVNL